MKSKRVFFVADIKITGNHLLYLYGWIDQKVFQHFLVAGTVQRKRHHSHVFGGKYPQVGDYPPHYKFFFLLQSLIWSTKKKAKTRRKHSCQDVSGLRFPNRSSCQAFSPWDRYQKSDSKTVFCWFWKHPPEGGITPLLQYLRWRWEIWKTSPATPLAPISNPHKPVNVLRCFQKSVHPEPSSSSSGLTMPRRF